MPISSHIPELPFFSFRNVELKLLYCSLFSVGDSCVLTKCQSRLFPRGFSYSFCEYEECVYMGAVLKVPDASLLFQTKDCNVMASKLMFLLDDLLWVLTDSQLKAMMKYAESLSEAMEKSAQQRKSLAPESVQVRES